MHTLGIAHRDIKVENILVHSDGTFKLADFGSASADVLDFASASKSQISKAMEQYEKYTTMMYRPPEMIDQYLGYRVDTKADIWMLGCVLYTICFARHPFQDAQKLAIINGHYNMVAYEDKYSHISEKMRDLIRLMLTPNPAKRPSIWDVELLVTNFEKIQQIELSEEAQEIKRKHEEFARAKGRREGIAPALVNSNNNSNNKQA
jgi:AP2-associated kinase